MRNSSLVKWFCAENVAGLSPPPKLRIRKRLFSYGRGAFLVHGSRTERRGGAQGRENAGMSSEKTGENPVRRKPKVS